jgi:ubiquinone/menaquinone biosynthesis C-methylase UbiE
VTGFDEIAPDYDRLRPAGDDWLEVAEHALVLLGPARRLLDVGCGTGRFAVLAAERLGGRVWGVDPSDAMLAQARARPGGQGVGWKAAAAERLPFRPGWFEAVHAHLVLHVVDVAAASLEFARVLAQSGRVVVVTFAPGHFAGFFLNPYFPSIRPIDEARFPDPASLAATLSAAGFEGCQVDLVTQRRTTTATDVLARVRGRYISTLRLVGEDEYAAGLAALEAEVDAGRESFDQTLRWALVSGRRG